MNIEFFFDNAWKWASNLPEKERPTMEKSKLGNHEDLDTLRETQIPEEFKEIIKLANNRMVQGSFRYGYITKQKPSSYDTATECIVRLNLYMEEGRNNLEYLVDALNMIRIEFYKGRLKGKDLHPIDDGVHAINLEKVKKEKITPSPTSKEKIKELKEFFISFAKFAKNYKSSKYVEIAWEQWLKNRFI